MARSKLQAGVNSLSITLKTVIKQGEIIKSRIDSGELVEGCCMSAVQTPVREAWSVAEDIVEQVRLTAEDQKFLLSMLNDAARSRLQAINFDDFDLIYEYFLQLIERK